MGPGIRSQMGTESLNPVRDFVPAGEEDWPSAPAGSLLTGIPPAGPAPSIVAFCNEPKGTAYEEVLEIASRICYAFCFIWRDDLKSHASAFQLADELAPWLCFEKRTNRWPGMTLFGLASARWYRITPESMSVLRRVNGLYEWLIPHRPEDLAFYLKDGRAWLGSISHEHAGWFDRSRMDPPLAKSLIKRLRKHGVFEPEPVDQP